jgi:hypothetical protein
MNEVTWQEDPEFIGANQAALVLNHMLREIEEDDSTDSDK